MVQEEAHSHPRVPTPRAPGATPPWLRELRAALPHGCTADLYNKGDSLPEEIVDGAARMMMRNMGKYEGNDWDPRDNMRDVTARETSLIAIWAGHRLSGFAAFQPDWWEEQKVMFLLELQLDEELRGAGIGKQMLWAVEQVSRHRRRKGLVLRVHRANEDAIAFYHKRPQLERSPTSMSVWAPTEMVSEEHDHYMHLWDKEARDQVFERAKRRQREQCEQHGIAARLSDQ